MLNWLLGFLVLLGLAHDSLGHEAIWQQGDGASLGCQLQGVLGELFGLAEAITALLEDQSELCCDLAFAFVWA